MSFRNYAVYLKVALKDHLMLIKNINLTFIMAERSVALNGLATPEGWSWRLSPTIQECMYVDSVET